VAETAGVDRVAIEELVEHYETKGRAVGRAGIAIGAVAGVVVGAIPLSPLSFAWPIPSSYGFATVLVGLGVGLLIGFVIGDSRARMYARMAEQARAQLVLEERISQSDRRVAQLVAALTARARASATPAPQPVAQPAPVQPAPHPVAPPEPEQQLRTVQQSATPTLVAVPAPPLSPPVSG
jgi:hypothetical protein